MSRSLPIFASLLALGVSCPGAQAADHPGSLAVDNWYRPTGHRSAGTHRHHPRVAAVMDDEITALGARRPLFAGAGGAALRGPGVAVVEYTEAHLPRGVLYNVPGPATFARTVVIRAKY